MTNFQVQTRSESHGINYYETLALAIAAADNDETIWKISFSLATGERVRLVYDGVVGWIYEPLVGGIV